jgi:hypothetical protein
MHVLFSVEYEMKFIELYSVYTDCSSDWLRLQGRAVAQVVSRRPLAAEARVRAASIHMAFVVDKRDAGTRFSPSSSVFSCHYIIPPSLSKLISCG